jgi:hypothetical protein
MRKDYDTTEERWGTSQGKWMQRSSGENLAQHGDISVVRCQAITSSTYRNRLAYRKYTFLRYDIIEKCNLDQYLQKTLGYVLEPKTKYKYLASLIS